MIALKDLRHDLGVHLAIGLDGSHAPLGAQINPPAVIVQASGGDYVTALDYCSDHIEFSVTIAAPPGDMAAVADALDDMIDQVRATCSERSPLGVLSGFKYQFVNVAGYTTLDVGDKPIPAVVATIGVDRQVD